MNQSPRLVGLLLLGLVVGLALSEGMVRLADPQWRIPYPPTCYAPGLYEPFDPHGYRLHPNQVMRDTAPWLHGGGITVHSNADGFRGPDLRRRDARRRVVVLGDSMIFGMGVEEAERCTERLEAAEPTWRVDNLGMVGYGPDLMLRTLEHVGIGLDPDVVVMAIFSHDFYRVMPEAFGVGFAVPRFRLIDSQLATVPYPERPLWSRLALVEGVRYAYWRYTAASFPLNAAILDRYRQLATEHGFVPAVAFLPSRNERWDDRRRARWLRDYAGAHGLPFLDLTAPLRAAGADQVYLPDDSHWNATGHQVVAEALRPFLATLVPPASSP